MTVPNQEITLTVEEAEYVAERLIELATQLPLRKRTHENALRLLGWFERRQA